MEILRERLASEGYAPARRRFPARLILSLMAVALVASACSDDGDDEAEVLGQTIEAEFATLTADELPEGFEPAPEVEFGGKMWEFDTIPGHFWKVLDDKGYAVGLHFQTTEPFPWAHDVPEGELLYLVYAVPGRCPGGNFDKSVTRDDVTISGSVPAGFDHWHGVVGAGPKFGHWLLHFPVRDFKLAGPPGNPMDGTQITGGIPQFMPICEPQ